jgi:hypothetical protein
MGKAQTSLNDYKYIVIPKKFDEFKEENKYQTSTLVKHLFTQKGFTTVWDDNMPEDLAINRCQALYVALRDKSSLFSTKSTIVLNDCNKQEIFATAEGKSKEKDYKKSYAEAIMIAMTSFDGLNYKYEGKPESTEPITVSFKNDVKKLDEEAETSIKAKNQDSTVIIQEATTERQTYMTKVPKESEYKKAEKTEPPVVQIANSEEQRFEPMETVSADIKKPEVEKTVSKVLTAAAVNTLYAQKLDNGFQLVDSTPKILLILRKTSLPDHYLAEGDGKSGIVYGKSGKWYFEYYSGDQLMVEELNIKF